MYNADTKEWKKLQDFSKSNEYTGNINDYGELHFYTDVKDATGKVVRSEVSKLSIKDNNPLKINAAQKDNGNTVTFTANGTGGSGKYTYKFIVYDTDTQQFTDLQDFSSDSSYTWNTTATDVGSKQIYVDVKDSEGNITRSNAVDVKVERVEEVVKPLAISATKKEADKTVTFTAEGSGGSGKYSYKFIVYNKTTNSWAKLQDFSSKNTFTWTKGNAGDRYFYVDVKDKNGNVVRSSVMNVTTTK